MSQSANLELNENMHAALFPISDRASQDENLVPWKIDAPDFVTLFSKINVVRNSRISKCSTSKWFYETREKNVVATGNTRDMPTPYQYLCPNNEHGCKHKATMIKMSKSTFDVARSCLQKRLLRSTRRKRSYVR